MKTSPKQYLTFEEVFYFFLQSWKSGFNFIFSFINYYYKVEFTRNNIPLPQSQNDFAALVNRHKEDLRNYLVKKGQFNISTRKYKGGIHSIKFIDDNINVSDEISKLWLIGKNVELMNTSISNTKSIDIESDNLIIDSSHITFGEIK